MWVAGSTKTQRRVSPIKNVLKVLPRILLIFVSLAAILFSCANSLEDLNKIIDPEEEPDITITNVEMQHSDSARLQVKMTAPSVKKYESAKEARDEFPQGMHVWLYEKTGELSAEITANWAKHDITIDLWEARNNVVLTNVEGRKLETEQLFWDQKKGTVYSENYTKITEANGNVYSGESFTAKQDLSDYKLNNKSGVGRTTIFLKDEEGQLE